MKRQRHHGSARAFLLLAALACPFSGCGILEQPLPAATQNFNLAALQEIQDDPRLTDDERRQRIRDLVGAPDTDAGNRLVEFLLTFAVP